MKFAVSLCMVLSAMIHVALARDASSPAEVQRTKSPGNVTYYIDPARGADTNSGDAPETAWRSFTHINQLFLSAGDRVEILAPGSFDRTLAIVGTGSQDAPIQVHFAPGRYDFFPAKAVRRQYQISNTNDDPEGDKAIGILVDRARHVEISGEGARLVYRGKMIEVCIDSSEAISISDLQFDYHRPTVSEFRVTAIGRGYADLEIHRDSQYKIEDGKLTWLGEGWSYDTGLAQELDLSNDEVWRRRDPLVGLQLEEMAPFRVRARGHRTMDLNRVYQIRQTRRDCAGVFVRRSRNVSWRNIRFYYLHGMGLVNQFSDSLTFDKVSISPDENSGRTCAGWADGIQISGCRGKVVVRDCTFSGLHDDAINIHGTHLRVVGQPSATEVRVRFMHNQTFGFLAFNPGDEITFVHWDSLETYGRNWVKQAVLVDPKEMLLTLKRPAPADLKENDAVENVTWNPEVWISGCKVTRIPTRGFLITTRGKVVVEGNRFYSIHMSAILLENDAKGWFESGPVRDMTIRGNYFFRCGAPVIHINPQNCIANNAVHQNLRIEGNHFLLRGTVAIEGRSTKGLTVVGNAFYWDGPLTPSQAMPTADCIHVRIEGNHYLPVSAWPQIRQTK